MRNFGTTYSPRWEASDDILVSFKTLHSAISFAEGRLAMPIISFE